MKKILIYIPIVLSVLVLGAHFMRYANGSLLPVAVAAVLLGLLFVRQPWVARLMQSVLVVGTVEWIITLVNLASRRADMGEPYLRLVLILGVVALVTFCAAMLFQTRTLKDTYKL